MVLSGRVRGEPILALRELLRAAEAEVIPFSEDHSRVALEAYLRFGKGRHRAALNFGDCLSYATAFVARQPLLFVGDDFSRTDIRRRDLLVSQRDRRIDSRRPPRRNVSRHQRDCRQYRRHQSKRRRIASLHAKEQARHQARQPPRQRQAQHHSAEPPASFPAPSPGAAHCPGPRPAPCECPAPAFSARTA